MWPHRTPLPVIPGDGADIVCIWERMLTCMYLMITFLAHKKRPLLPALKNELGDDSQRGFLCIWDGPGWPFSHDELCLQQSGPRQPGSRCCPPALRNAGCHRCSHFLKTHSPPYDVPSNTQQNTIPGVGGDHMLCVFSRYG